MTFDLRSHTVIVVDDEVFTRQTVARLLTALGTTRVVQAEDGEEALAASWTIEGGPALVISDFNMPKIDGLSLLKSIRMGQCGLDRAAPFVMLTAYSERDVVDAALQLDVSAFLIKPVSRTALEKRLTRLQRVEADRAWLQSVDAYSAVDVAIAPEAFEYGAAEEGDAVPILNGGKSKNGPASRKAFLKDHESESFAEALARGASSASDDGTDLLKFLLSRDADREGILAADESESEEAIAARLTSVADAAPDSSLVADIVAGTRHLIAEIGKGETATMLASLDPVERSGILPLSEIAALLNTDHEKPADRPRPAVSRDWHEEARAVYDIPAGAVSIQNVFMRDGHLVIGTGTELTETVIRILSHLDRLDALDLPSDVGTGRRMVRAVIPPDAAAPAEEAQPIPAPHPRPVMARPRHAAGPERAIGPTEIKAGIKLSRDVRTVNGALYLSAGTVLTERHVGVLESLYEAGKLTSKIWMALGSS